MLLQLKLLIDRTSDREYGKNRAAIRNELISFVKLSPRDGARAILFLPIPVSIETYCVLPRKNSFIFDENSICVRYAGDMKYVASERSLEFLQSSLIRFFLKYTSTELLQSTSAKYLI